jgi:probable O-glycosylation ligase (exosortase A-associated)
VVVVGGLALAAVFATAILPEKVFQRADTIAGYQDDGSANQRLESWSVAWNVAKDRPFVGAGFEFEQAGGDRWLDYGSEDYRKFMIAANKDSSAAHSIYFQVLGQHGFVAFSLYVALLVSVCLTLVRVWAKGSQSPQTAWTSTYAVGLLIGLMGYFVSGAFLSSAYFDLAWLYFALAAVLMREVMANAPSSAEESSALAPVR